MIFDVRVWTSDIIIIILLTIIFLLLYLLTVKICLSESWLI